MRLLTGVVAALVSLAIMTTTVACGRKDKETPDQQRAGIAALEKERAALHVRLEELSVRDPRIEGMPDAAVRIGVPTTLARDLIQRVAAGVVDQVTLELKNIKDRKSVV